LTEIVSSAEGDIPDVVMESAVSGVETRATLDEADYQKLVARLENHFAQVLTEKLVSTSLAPLPVVETEHAVLPADPPVTLSEEAYELLVDRLEDHLENLLTQKLTLYLDRMKAQIIEQITEEIRLDLAERLPDTRDLP
jgi:hypothetical protein